MKKGSNALFRFFIVLAVLMSAAAIGSTALSASSVFSPVGNGSISGYVYESGSAIPVANANVYVRLNDENDTVGQAQTNAQGYFQVVNLPPNTNYKLDVWAAGYLRAYYPGVADWDQAAAITVTDGQDTPNVTSHVIKADSFVKGKVTHADGSPAANVWMEAFHQDGWFVGVSADQAGNYTIPVILGSWYITPYDPPNTFNQRHVYVDQGQTVSGVDFLYGASGSISGYVYEQDGITPVAYADVAARIINENDKVGVAQTNDQGYYQITHLYPASNYKVSVSASGYLNSYYPGVAGWHLAPTITVVNGQDTSNINIMLPKADAFISGSVTHADGSPAAYVWMEAFHQDGWFVGVRADQNGHYTTPVTMGSWYIFPYDPPNTFTQRHVYVDQGQTVSGVDFHYGATGSISGRVTMQDGITPIPNAFVAAGIIDANDRVGETYTDAQGYYRITHLYTDTLYKVSVSASGYGETYYPGVSSWSHAATVAVINGQDTPDIDVSMGVVNLSIDHNNGSPGSYFTVSGGNFPATSTATVTVNGQVLSTAITVDAAGNLSFQLETSLADEGRYFVTVSVNPSATTSFSLDDSDPFRPQTGSGPIIHVPQGIAYTRFLWMPMILR